MTAQNRPGQTVPDQTVHAQTVPTLRRARRGSAFVALTAAAVDEVYFSRYHRFGSMLSLIASSVLENIGYRQLHVIWRLRGWWQALRGSEQQWGVMTRRGFTTEGAS